MEDHLTRLHFDKKSNREFGPDFLIEITNKPDSKTYPSKKIIFKMKKVEVPT